MYYSQLKQLCSNKFLSWKKDVIQSRHGHDGIIVLNCSNKRSALLGRIIGPPDFSEGKDWTNRAKNKVDTKNTTHPPSDIAIV